MRAIVDQPSNLFTLVDVIDSLNVPYHPALLPAPTIQFPIVVVSAWNDDELEPSAEPPVIELDVLSPNRDSIYRQEYPVAIWSEDRSARVVLPLMGVPAAIEGYYTASQRMRRPGQDWSAAISARYLVKHVLIQMPQGMIIRPPAAG